MRSNTTTKCTGKPDGSPIPKNPIEDNSVREEAVQKNQIKVEQDQPVKTPTQSESDYIYSAPKDMWLLTYEVNDNGVGQILLPPSLSVLLQSDRVTISPFAGGLLIRSA